MSKYEIDDPDGTADQCCIYLPLKKPVLKNGPLYTVICVYLTEEDTERQL